MSETNKEIPHYRILAVHGFFGPDDHLYDLDKEIWFEGTPNDEMEPLNEAARVRLSVELERLDRLARIAAEKLNRPFVERPRDLDGAIVLATALQRDNQHIMSVPKDVTTIGELDSQPVPETGGTQPKRGRGRPVGSGKGKPALTLQAHAA